MAASCRFCHGELSDDRANRSVMVCATCAPPPYTCNSCGQTQDEWPDYCPECGKKLSRYAALEAGRPEPDRGMPNEPAEAPEQGGSRSGSGTNRFLRVFYLTTAVLGTSLLFLNTVNPDGICSFSDGWGMRDCSGTSSSPNTITFPSPDPALCGNLPEALAAGIGCESAERGGALTYQSLTLEQYFSATDSVAQHDADLGQSDADVCATHAQKVRDLGLSLPIESCLTNWGSGVDSTLRELDRIQPPPEVESLHLELREVYSAVSTTIDGQLVRIGSVDDYASLADWSVDLMGAFWNASVVEETICPGLRDIAGSRQITFGCDFRSWPVFLPGFLGE